MADYKDFLSRVMGEVPGCPVPKMVDAVRDAVREFCSKTYIWNEVVDCEIKEGESLAFVFAPRGSMVEAVLTDQRRKDTFPYRIILKENRNPVELEQEPNADKEMKIRVALKPSSTSETCPDFLFNGFAEEIGYGAKGRLLFEVGKPWGNHKLAVFYFNLFHKAMSAERIKIQQGYSGRGSMIRPRRFV